MRLSGFKLPVERISASSLSTAIQCPEQFRRKYVLKQRDAMYVDRFAGIVDHEVWEWYFASNRNEFDFDTAYQTSWNRLLEDQGDEVDWRDEDPTSVYTRGIKMLHAYEPVARELEPEAVEEWIEVPIEGIPVPLVGKIDIRQKQKIIDRKTNKTRLSKPKPKWSFQARMYQLAYPLPYEIHVITKQVTPQVVTARESEELLLPVFNPDTTIKMIRHTVERINDLYCRYGKDEPWPTEGTLHDFLCAYCGFGPKYAANCSAWQS